MAEGFDLTTYYAKRIIGDTAAVDAEKALLQTGDGITTDTWILHRTNRTNKLYGIKYKYDSSNHDKIEYYGKTSSDNATAWIQLDTGDASFIGNVTANKFIGPLQGNADTASAANITTTANTLAYYSNTTGAFADTGIKYFSGTANAGKTYIGWVKFASIDIGTNNYWGDKIYDIFLDRGYNSPQSEVYSIRVSVGWGASHIIQLSGRAGSQIMNKFRIVRDHTNHIAYFEYYVNTSYTTHQNTVNIKILGYHGAAVTLMNTVQTEEDSEFNYKEEISLVSNSIVGNLTGNASTATNVAWSGVQNPPAQATRWPTWDEVTSKPSTFTPSTHLQAIANGGTGATTAQDATWNLLHVADPGNLNNAKRMGNFKISNTTTNTPVSGMWGATWNIVDDTAAGNNGTSGSTWQLVFRSASNGMWLRCITNEGSWSEYAHFLSDKNYSSYALPLSGGTLSGNIYVSKAGETYVRATNTTTSCSIELNSYTDKHGLWSNGYWNGSTYTASSKWLIYRGTDGNVIVNGNITGNAATATKATQDGSGNVITSKYVTIDTAQTITGTKSWGTSGAGGQLNGAATNGGINSIRIGDDVWLGDCNAGGIMGMKSTGTNCGFYFYNSSGTQIGQLYNNGSEMICNKTYHSNGGYLKSTLNSNTVTIGSQNTSYCHIENSANIPFYFNRSIGIAQGATIGFTSNQYRPYQIYLGRNTTAESRALNSANPLIEFSNSDRSQYAQLVYTDYNSQGGSDSLTFVSNQNDLRVYAPKVHNAVWNDYAETRATDITEPGRVVTENGKTMTLANERLLPGCRIISDTYGTCMGREEDTPIAVSGRVLVYPYRNRNDYPLGAAVCSAPNGTVDIMTREEIINYSERIIGTVSEIPDYEYWGAGQDGKLQIAVNNRIWIYVR